MAKKNVEVVALSLNLDGWSERVIGSAPNLKAGKAKADSLNEKRGDDSEAPAMVCYVARFSKS